MIRYDYKKTVVIWTDDKKVQEDLKKIVKELRFNPKVVDNADNTEVMAIHSFLIFAKSSLVQADFFDKRSIAIRSGELTIVFIDSSRPYPKFSSMDIDQINISNKEEVKSVIIQKSIQAAKFQRRRVAMKKRFNRLFFIYTLLKETGGVKMDDMLFRTKISKRTYYRDIETIKEICVDMNIESLGNGDFRV
jgi:hypothetical protein